MNGPDIFASFDDANVNERLFIVQIFTLLTDIFKIITRVLIYFIIYNGEINFLKK